MEKYSIYIIGAICGFSYGAFVGFCKYVLLWMQIAKSKKATIKAESVATRAFLGMLINVVALSVTLLFRKSEVIDFSALAIATAFALSIASRLFSVKEIVSKKQVINDNGGKK